MTSLRCYMEKRTTGNWNKMYPSFSVKISQINHYFLFPNVKDTMSFEWGLIAVSDNECGHQYTIVCRYDSSYNSGAVYARPAPHCDV